LRTIGFAWGRLLLFAILYQLVATPSHGFPDKNPAFSVLVRLLSRSLDSQTYAQAYAMPLE
jgi:hypothetical protein